MSKHLDVSPAEAIEFLAFIMGWGEGFVPVFLDGRLEMRHSLAGRGASRLAGRAAAWDFERSAQVEIGLPEQRRDSGGPGGCSVLWAWLESADSAWRAATQVPRPPTMVLRMGGAARRLAFWALEGRVAYGAVVAANKRLAYALRAPQKWAEPEALRAPLPGTFLRLGRLRPVPVLVTAMDIDRTCPLAAAVRGLKDPPPADGWKERKDRR